MTFDISFIALCVTTIVVFTIYVKYAPVKETEVLRASYRNLETQVRCAQEQAALALHDLQLLRETIAEQRDADRARISRCEVQVESNERNMTKLAAQFKDALVEVKQESTKLSMLVSNQPQRRVGL